MIVDGLLGTGLMRAPRDDVAALITHANAHPAPVVALDIPSGLMAQTGATPGVSIEAAHTVTFIALKPGLLTGKARDVVGRYITTHWGWKTGWLDRIPTSPALMPPCLLSGCLRAAPHPIRVIMAGC